MRGHTFEKDIAPALEDMALRGSLTNLEVRMYPSGAGVYGAEFMSQAMQPDKRLLRLLADPYLERRSPMPDRG